MLKDVELIKWRRKAAELSAIEATENALKIKTEITVLEENLRLERYDSWCYNFSDNFSMDCCSVCICFTERHLQSI